VTHQHGADSTALLLLILGLAVGYEALTLRTASHRPWSPVRAISFMTGCGLLILALAPGQHTDFPTHVRQHLVVGMLAPTALVLGAPVTLVLRTLPTAAARRVSRIMHLGVAVLLGHPVTALVLSVGVLVVLHVTPLYTTVTTDPVLHNLVLVHFLISGYLFAWVIAGPDPAPRRPSVRYRLVVLGVAIAAHAVLSQLLFAGVVGDAAVPDADRRAGATLLYYGGDLAELLLAAALVTTWPVRRRRGAVGSGAGSTVDSQTSVTTAPRGGR
jgi:putative membrane protein